MTTDKRKQTGSGPALRRAGAAGMLCAAVTATHAALAAPPSAPTHLRVNDVVNPVGVGETPYFGWLVNDPDSNEIQTAYQILVASSETGLASDHGDLWDSGKTASRLQNHVTYAGTALESDRRVYWKVRTWDRDDSGGPWSDPATFVVGLKHNKDWAGAHWIRRDTSDADDYTYYRKRVALPGRTIQRATIYISSVHRYALYLNDTLVGKGPAYHYPQYQYYNAYDVTSLIRHGAANQFAVFNHWFGGGQGRPASERGVIMKAIVRYTDGSRDEIGTDGAWRQSRAAAWSLADLKHRNRGEGVGYVERVDARELTPDWYTLGFDDTSWGAATVIGAHPVAPWTGTMAPDLSRIEEHLVAPASIADLGSGKCVVDLGKVYAGMPRIRFTGGTSGTTVGMRGGYALDASGEIDTSKSQKTDLSYYAILDGGSFVYEPTEYLGMRYFQIDNAPMPVTTDTFSFVIRYSRMDTAASSFASPNPTLNAVWAFMKHSILTCAQEEFVDTPTREKGGFLGDAAIQSMVAMPVMNERVLTRRALSEFLQSMEQHWPGTGRMNAVYPNNDGARDIPDYTQAYPVWAWDYYLETGDRAFLSSHYAKLKEIADYVHAHRDGDTGLISNLTGGGGPYEYGIVDWPAPMRFGYDMTYARTVINGWAYADYDIISKIAGELGRTDDRDRYRVRANELESAVNARLVNGPGVYVDGLDESGVQSAHVSQHANMFPLALGIVPEEHLANVVDKVKELDMSVGMVTLPWLIRALGEAGEGEQLVELLTNPDRPGWARCLARGATATWECWDADTAGQSMSHAWGAAGLEAYVRYILGIKRLKPQYEEVLIRPLDFGSALTGAEGTIPTDRGDISVAWRNVDGTTYRLEVDLPVSVTAEVCLPRGAATGPKVYLDGAEVTAIEDRGTFRFAGVGSGKHTVVRADATDAPNP